VRIIEIERALGGGDSRLHGKNAGHTNSYERRCDNTQKTITLQKGNPRHA
jgi:hypothetical protein